METVYRACDGRIFEDSYDCIVYEEQFRWPHLKEVIIYDKNGNPLPENDNATDTSYNESQRVVIPTEAACDDFMDMVNDRGFSAYITIDCPGTWVYDDDVGEFRYGSCD